MKVSERATKIKTSPTLALAAKATELKSEGVDVVSLSVGEPDWETFGVCKESGIRAIHDNITRYTPASGTGTLKKAIAEDFKKRFGLEVKPSHVVVTPGAKYAVQQALWAMVNPGDKVGVLVPFWASYTTMVEIAEGVPVLVPTQKDGALIEQEMQKAIDKGVTTFLINSPNNPSGNYLKEKDYKFLQDLMKKNPSLQLILDDIYSELYWGEKEHCPHLLDFAPEMFDRVVAVSGASKAFSMTGWRIGWVIGPEVVTKAIGSYQSQTTGCPNSIAQEATLAGVKFGKEDIVKVSQVLKKRAQAGYAQLKSIPGVEVLKPEAAFYFWADFSEILKRYKLTDTQFCQNLLEAKAVVVVPGVEFGMVGHIRLSFAVSEEDFGKGVERIKEFIEEL